jgi:uncharacterized protein YciI
MEKKHFFIRLIPPRTSFTTDMTEAERAIMQEHVVYWKGLLDKGIAIVYGPVFDPKGGYGIGIVEIDDEEGVQDIMKNDPTMKSGNFTYEINNMRAVRRK